MRRITLRVAVALVTFFVGIGVSILWLINRSSEVGTIENPPCHSCSQIYSTSPELPTVSFCDFVRKPKHYAGKVIRIRAILDYDSGQKFLSDKTCEEKAIYAEYDESMQSCAGAKKKLDTLLGRNPGWFKMPVDGNAGVTVIGRYGRIDNSRFIQKGDNGFLILCVERAQAVNETP
jgi:hypothetical protein